MIKVHKSTTYQSITREKIVERHPKDVNDNMMSRKELLE